MIPAIGGQAKPFRRILLDSMTVKSSDLPFDLKGLLDEKVDLYNRVSFIEHDPISIPHRFSEKKDIEIAGFFAATLAWGQRKTIISKCTELMSLMDDSPYQFVTQHEPTDLDGLRKFIHRTFNFIDTSYFIRFLKFHYKKNDSLETAFCLSDENEIRIRLKKFHEYFFSLTDYPVRTQKHVATPARNSACKRLNMFLRWMVRKDDRKVDFGIWNRITPSMLICPCDVHVERISRGLGLITRKQLDWTAALELTINLRKFDIDDPVKYDFALFGLGIESREIKPSSPIRWI